MSYTSRSHAPISWLAEGHHHLDRPPLQPPPVPTPSFRRTRHASGCWQLQLRATRALLQATAPGQARVAAVAARDADPTQSGTALGRGPSLRQGDMVLLLCVGLSFSAEVRNLREIGPASTNTHRMSELSHVTWE